jgi:hypothetical protein
MNIEKEFSKIKENIDNKFSGVVLLEVWEYTKFHNSIPNVIGAITRYVTKKGFQINRKEFLEEFGFEGTEHAEKNTKQKFIDGSMKELEGIFSMFGQGTKLIGWLARKLFSKTTKQNKVIDLYVDGIKQREKCFIEIINRGYRFELKMEIK